jgi:hypothetical protein
MCWDVMSFGKKFMDVPEDSAATILQCCLPFSDLHF